jgi:hypothetical protein
MIMMQAVIHSIHTIYTRYLLLIDVMDSSPESSAFISADSHPRKNSQGDMKNHTNLVIQDSLSPSLRKRQGNAFIITVKASSGDMKK